MLTRTVPIPTEEVKLPARTVDLNPLMTSRAESVVVAELLDQWIEF